MAGLGEAPHALSNKRVGHSVSLLSPISHATGYRTACRPLVTHYSALNSKVRLASSVARVRCSRKSARVLSDSIKGAYLIVQLQLTCCRCPSHTVLTGRVRPAAATTLGHSHSLVHSLRAFPCYVAPNGIVRHREARGARVVCMCGGRICAILHELRSP